MKEIRAKQELRKIVKNRLREQAAQGAEKSEAIWKRLGQLDCFNSMKKGGNLLVYLDFDHEVQTSRFLSEFLNFDRPEIKEKPTIYVPCCINNDILPIRLESSDKLEQGKMSILEPKREFVQAKNRRLDPEEFDLVLVPGLAFDLQGNRLGRGKGYYDRFLAKLSSKTKLVALAFECQIFEHVPHESHDRPVDRIVTEQRIIP